MFATGVETSIPRIQNGRARVDQMVSCGLHRMWRDDFDLVQALGLDSLRYGPPLHTTLIGPRRFNWEFADLTFADLRRRNITPIVDLRHFGVPGTALPTQNVCLAVPITPPAEFDGPASLRRVQDASELRQVELANQAEGEGEASRR